MISRLLVIGFLYAAMFLGWICVGVFMLLAPARFIRFCSDNILVLGESRPREAGKWLVRIVGAGFVAFAIRFALRIADTVR